jgi:uncharacterized repeat protein (TIGR03803 family)
VLHVFGVGSDGAHPFGLVFGHNGLLYGNTTNGGSDGVSGTIFSLAPAAAGQPWTETIVWNFNVATSDGAVPKGNLAIDKSGALYGTTSGSGGPAPYGTVFKLVP